MAISQTFYPVRIPSSPQSQHSTRILYPSALDSTATLCFDNNKKRQPFESLGRPARETKTASFPLPPARSPSMVKTTRTLSGAGVKRKPVPVTGSSRPSGSTTTTTTTNNNNNVLTVAAASIDTQNKPVGKGQQQEQRRPSLQSLTLDLEGLDLGQGSRTTLEQTTRDEAGSSRRPLDSRSRFHSTSMAKLRSDGVVGSVAEEKQQVEDSFFAHLRNCEDSHDILDTAHVLSLSDPSQQSEEKGEAFTSAAEQVLGGFASLGYSSAAPSQSNLLASDVEMDGYSSLPASPRMGITNHCKSRRSPWKTLLPILLDPMNTLDILSIEEMGLHSIDVGSSSDWEGFQLSFPFDLSHQAGTIGDKNVNINNAAQWAIARSTKRQRKWIVTPEPASPSRTIVVSDHIVSRQAPRIFSGQAMLQLRFLQAGTTSAPDVTILLANPLTHHSMATQDEIPLQSKKEMVDTSINKLALYKNPSVDSLSDSQLQIAKPAADDEWPSMRSMAVAAASSSSAGLGRLDPRPPLFHAKSSSTIHATVPMVHLDSRRPSLGKSVSHESLPFHSPLPDTPRRTPRSSLGNSSHDLTLFAFSGYPSQPVHDRDLAFADYSMGLSASSQVGQMANNTAPSPRSSVQANSTRDAKVRVPVLSTIDSERMAEYHRMSNDRHAPSGLQIDWQASSSTTGLTRPSGRKDRRLSEWFRKKVMTTGLVSPPLFSPPLPPAWEQKKEQNQQSFYGVAATSTAVRPTSSKPTKAVKPKTLSNASKSSGSMTAASSSKGDNVQSWQSESSPPVAGSPFNLSQSSLSSTKQGRDSSEDKRFHGTSKPMNMIKAPPLAQMHTYHGHNVWPGVSSHRNERRRSNSDDNLVALGEAARRRQEVANTREILTPPKLTSNWVDDNDEDDSLNKLSLSMPSQSVLSTYGTATLESKLSSIDLLDLDNCPSRAMTMLIPLPTSYKRSDQMATRYLRVSFVPFESESVPTSAHGDESDQDIWLGSSTAMGANSSSSGWYKKVKNAWTTGARSSSPGSNEEELQSIVNDNQVAYLTSTVEAFRIIAKVLEHPGHHDHTTHRENALLPQPTPFPVILGICDQQRSLKLIPEGWQAIGLASGPAITDDPLYGIADLIMAGCAACMEL